MTMCMYDIYVVYYAYVYTIYYIYIIHVYIHIKYKMRCSKLHIHIVFREHLCMYEQASAYVSVHMEYKQNRYNLLTSVDSFSAFTCEVLRN